MLESKLSVFYVDAAAVAAFVMYFFILYIGVVIDQLLFVVY